MERRRIGYARLLAAALVTAMFVVACFGLSPVILDASAGSSPLSANLGVHGPSEHALAVGSRSGSTGLSAAIAFGGSALTSLVSPGRATSVATLTPLGWQKLASGLVPLPLRI